MPRHLHFGAGALGLGLILPVLSQSGLEIVVVQRAGRKIESLAESSGLFEVEFIGGLSGMREIKPFSAGSLLPLGSDCEPAINALASEDTILVTTSLTWQGLEELVPVLREGLLRRGEGHPTLTVLFCENTIGENCQALIDEEQWEQRVEFLPSVVDRMCGIDEAYSSRVRVQAEEYSWWVTGRPTEESVAKLLAGLGIQLVDDVRPYRVLKRYMVNIPHLAVTLMARRAGWPSVAIYLRTTTGERYLKGVFRECVEVMAHHATSQAVDMPFTEDYVRGFGEEVFTRFQLNPEATTRVLKLLRRDTLPQFSKALLERLVVPAEDHIQVFGSPPTHLTQALHAAVRMMSLEDWTVLPG
ncbi:MAG: hypothetical protein ACJ74O_17790 [Frankiaceae bacterium]